MIIGTLNTRTLIGQERLWELEEALGSIRWDIVGLAEIRRNNEMISETLNGSILMHSCAENSRFGVGFIVKQYLKNKIMEFKPVSTRLASLKIKMKNIILTMIQVHAPTSESTLEEIEAFYDKLEEEISLVKDKKFLSIIGDYNAKVGWKKWGDSEAMGPNGVGTRNDRGEILINLANRNNLHILNTYNNTITRPVSGHGALLTIQSMK